MFNSYPQEQLPESVKPLKRQEMSPDERAANQIAYSIEQLSRQTLSDGKRWNEAMTSISKAIDEYLHDEDVNKRIDFFNLIGEKIGDNPASKDFLRQVRGF